MNRFRKNDKKSIYEIFKSCRLCGAGGGYKMPIIQNIVAPDSGDMEVELRQKIRECVQIEVSLKDKMPPLICELCADKINDFYEFLEMCRDTNIKTRHKLGLPPQKLSVGTPDAGDCILGVTEPVFVNEDSDNETLSVKQNKTVRPSRHDKKKIVDSRSTRSSVPLKQRSVSPRRSRSGQVIQLLDSDEELQNNKRITMKDKKRRSPSPAPLKGSRKPVKGILRNSNTTPVKSKCEGVKRPSSSSSKDEEPRSKRVKISSPKVPERPKKPPAPPPELHKCHLCTETFSKTSALNKHLSTVHVVSLQSVRLACNACREWFTSAAERDAHHRGHRVTGYTCARCEHYEPSGYAQYISHQCKPWPEIPDVECDSCWNKFATRNLLESHRCPGENGRPGGNCYKCGKRLMLYKNLIKHQAGCDKKRRNTFNYNSIRGVDRRTIDKAKGAHVPLVRCDELIVFTERPVYANRLAPNFGLVRSYFYPFLTNIKQVWKNRMVKYENNFYSYETDSSGDETSPQIEKLGLLALRKIYSEKLLGEKQVRRERRHKLVRREIKEENKPEHTADKTDADAEKNQPQADFDDMLDSHNDSTINDLISKLDSDIENDFGGVGNDTTIDSGAKVDQNLSTACNPDSKVDETPETEESAPDNNVINNAEVSDGIAVVTNDVTVDTDKKTEHSSVGVDITAHSESKSMDIKDDFHPTVENTANSDSKPDESNSLVSENDNHILVNDSEDNCKAEDGDKTVAHKEGSEVLNDKIKETNGDILQIKGNEASIDVRLSRPKDDACKNDENPDTNGASNVEQSHSNHSDLSEEKPDADIKIDQQSESGVDKIEIGLNEQDSNLDELDEISNGDVMDDKELLKELDAQIEANDSSRNRDEIVVNENNHKFSNSTDSVGDSNVKDLSKGKPDADSVKCNDNVENNPRPSNNLDEISDGEFD